MTIETRNSIKRYRCDICRKLCHFPIVIHDTISRETVHACTPKCSEEYWMRYQLSLFNPDGNTGVKTNSTGAQ